MKIFETSFEAGVVVVTLTNEKGTIVRAFTPRVKPTWLHAKDGEPTDTVSRIKFKVQEKKDNSQLKLDVLRLIKAIPGRSKSFYTQLSLEDGGIRGSQERKDKAIEEMINANQIKRILLEKAIGRKNHELFAT